MNLQGHASSAAMQGDEMVLLHHHRGFRFDIAANLIGANHIRQWQSRHNRARIPWFAETAARHQRTVPQFAPY